MVASCKHSLSTPAAADPDTARTGLGRSRPRGKEPRSFREGIPVRARSSGPGRGRGRTGGVRTPEMSRTRDFLLLKTADPDWRAAGAAAGRSEPGEAPNTRPVRNYHLLRTSWTTRTRGLNWSIRLLR